MQFFKIDDVISDDGQPAESQFVASPGARVGDAPMCTTCGGFTGMCAWLPPLRIELETWGNSYPDLVLSGAVLLVTHRFVEHWNDSGLIGLDNVRPVQITRVRSHRKMKAAVPAYYFARANTGTTAIDLEASEFEHEGQVCSACRLGDVLKRWKRIVIEESTWSGADMFVPRGLPSSIFVTQRVIELVERRKLLNASFIPAESFARDYYPWELRSE